MKDSVFILTEQWQSNTKECMDAIIKQAVTAWLTKELTK